MYDSNDLVLAEAKNLVAERLPAGYRVGCSGTVTSKDDGGSVDERHFFVVDERGRRRSYAYSAVALEGLVSEIRRLAVEVRRIEAWKKKSEVSERDIDALATDLCPYLPRSKGTRWGRAGVVSSPCCGHEVPAGTWWIHEDSGMPAEAKTGRVTVRGSDLFFTDARDFGRYLIALKENRFEARARAVGAQQPSRPQRQAARA